MDKLLQQCPFDICHRSRSVCCMVSSFLASSPTVDAAGLHPGCVVRRAPSTVQSRNARIHQTNEWHGTPGFGSRPETQLRVIGRARGQGGEFLDDQWSRGQALKHPEKETIPDSPTTQLHLSELSQKDELHGHQFAENLPTCLTYLASQTAACRHYFCASILQHPMVTPRVDVQASKERTMSGGWFPVLGSEGVPDRWHQHGTFCR